MSLHPPDWEQHGKAAGYVRNYAMAEVADALLAVWDLESRGTYSMIRIAHKKRLRIFVMDSSGNRVKSIPKALR